MARCLANPIRAAVVIALLARSAAAQDGSTQVTFTVGPTVVDFAGFGGALGGAAAQLRVSHFFSRNLGGELSAFAILPTGGSASLATCVPGNSCESRATPRLLNGVLVSPFVFAGNTGLRITLGAGAVRAAGGQGPGARASAAGALGVDWDSRSTSRFAPIIGVRVVRLATPIYGARHLLLPGVGLTF